MYSDFSFGKLLRHIESGETINRPAGSPTEEHMRTVMEGYVANLGASNAEQFKAFTEKYLALPRQGEDPVGTRPVTITGIGDESHADLAQLIDVPFTPIKAEMTATPTFSLTNQAAMSFRLWAEVDGRNLTIDIIEVMTFNEEGKVTEQFAYWGVENVTLLD